ncbi:MAG: hypothetical protein QXQ02_02205 [Halobacteria archaeon]
MSYKSYKEYIREVVTGTPNILPKELEIMEVVIQNILDRKPKNLGESWRRFPLVEFEKKQGNLSYRMGSEEIMKVRGPWIYYVISFFHEIDVDAFFVTSHANHNASFYVSISDLKKEYPYLEEEEIYKYAYSTIETVFEFVIFIIIDCTKWYISPEEENGSEGLESEQRFEYVESGNKWFLPTTDFPRWKKGEKFS